MALGWVSLQRKEREVWHRDTGKEADAGDTWSPQKLEEAGRLLPPLERQEGAWLRQPHDSTSGTVGEYISVVLSPPVYGGLLWRPQETQGVCS